MLNYIYSDTIPTGARVHNFYGNMYVLCAHILKNIKWEKKSNMAYISLLLQFLKGVFSWSVVLNQFKENDYKQ